MIPPTNDPTGPARQLFEYLWPEKKWPRRLRVVWRQTFNMHQRSPASYGITYYTMSYRARLVELYAYMSNPLSTVVHELLHVAEPGLEHGKKFDAIVAEKCRLVGVDPNDHGVTRRLYSEPDRLRPGQRAALAAIQRETGWLSGVDAESF